MPTYCTDAQLTDELMDHLPEEITSSYRSSAIGDSSSELDGLVGLSFPLDYSTSSQKFPNITDSPATPIVIKRCAIWLAASYCWVTMSATSRLTTEAAESSPAEMYRSLVTNEQGTGLADRIRDGQIQVILSDGTIIGTSEDPLGGAVNYSESSRYIPINTGRYNESGSQLGASVGQSLDGF